jgi:hypothetical protein
MCATYLNPSVCSDVVRFKTICGISPDKASNNEQNLVRNSREGNVWCRECPLPRPDHFQVVQELKNLRYYGSACLISQQIWMILYLFNSLP